MSNESRPVVSVIRSVRRAFENRVQNGVTAYTSNSDVAPIVRFPGYILSEV
jgi:hypothetical protein